VKLIDFVGAPTKKETVISGGKKTLRISEADIEETFSARP